MVLDLLTIKRPSHHSKLYVLLYTIQPCSTILLHARPPREFCGCKVLWAITGIGIECVKGSSVQWTKIVHHVACLGCRKTIFSMISKAKHQRALFKDCSRWDQRLLFQTGIPICCHQLIKLGCNVGEFEVEFFCWLLIPVSCGFCKENRNPLDYKSCEEN